jgi:hypothetical protein
MSWVSDCDGGDSPLCLSGAIFYRMVYTRCLSVETQDVQGVQGVQDIIPSRPGPSSLDMEHRRLVSPSPSSASIRKSRIPEKSTTEINAPWPTTLNPKLRDPADPWLVHSLTPEAWACQHHIGPISSVRGLGDMYVARPHCTDWRTLLGDICTWYISMWICMSMYAHYLHWDHTVGDTVGTGHGLGRSVINVVPEFAAGTGAMQYNILYDNTIQHNTIQYNTAPPPVISVRQTVYRPCPSKRAADTNLSGRSAIQRSRNNLDQIHKAA